MSDSRQHVHDLIDRLPPAQLTALATLLETMLDPGREEELAVAEAKQWLQKNGGHGIPHDDVLADFGLTGEEFQRAGRI